jgi:hypothetical protein
MPRARPPGIEVEAGRALGRPGAGLAVLIGPVTQTNWLFLYDVGRGQRSYPPCGSRATCGCSSMAEHQLPKLTVRVRFPSSALITNGQVGSSFRTLGRLSF